MKAITTARGRLVAALAAASLAACAPAPKLPEPPPALPAPVVGMPVPPALPAPAPVAPLTLEDYKKLVAAQIAVRSAQANDGPLPELLKSIVVLEITIDRVGNPIGIAVYRSNGFRYLESRALESVVRAAPFAYPAEAVLQGIGSVTFLETFLFRNDDSFQIRSLVSHPQRG